MASALTGQAIVDFFSKRVDLIEAITTLKNRRFNRVHSLSDTPVLNVWYTGLIVYKNSVRYIWNL